MTLRMQICRASFAMGNFLFQSIFCTLRNVLFEIFLIDKIVLWNENEKDKSVLRIKITTIAAR